MFQFIKNYNQRGGVLCNEEKKNLCKSKGKICNEKTGRCNKIYEVKPKKKRGRKPKVKVNVKVEPKEHVNINKKCDKKKIELCKSEGKTCNEKTGRCNKIYEVKPKKKRGRPKKIENVAVTPKDNEMNMKNIARVNKVKPLKKIKNTILVLHSKHDHNNAFDEDGDVGLFGLFKKFKNFRFQYNKVGTMKDIVNSFIALKSPIAHCVLMGHGSKDSLFLTKSGIRKNTKNFMILSSLLKENLVPNSSILLHSCCVGKGGLKADNFAHNLSIALPNHIIFASNLEISRGELFCTLAENDLKSGLLNMDYVIMGRKSGHKLHKFLYTEPGVAFDIHVGGKKSDKIVFKV